MHPPILVLHNWQRSLPARWLTLAKIIVREGILGGDWTGVRRGLQIASRGTGGRFAIPNALEAALARSGVPFRTLHAPTPLSEELAVVVQDPSALSWALRRKREGALKFVVAGPMIVNLPREAGEIFLDPAIDARLYFSGWQRELFTREDPRAAEGAHLWFAGVDPEAWSPPSSGPAERSILIYVKTDEPVLLGAVRRELGRTGSPVIELTYGTHTSDEWREALSKASLVVFLSRSETQGLAMMEAWSMDVPTLHWDPGVMHYLGRSYPGASSCWYLSPEAGMAFRDIEEFAPAFSMFQEALAKGDFTPRKHLLTNFTLEHSARRLMDVVQSVREGR